MTSVGELDTTLPSALAWASDACRNALADYRAGLIGDEDLRRLLSGARLVRLRQVVDELAREAQAATEENW